MEFGIWSLEFGIWNLDFGFWNLEFGFWNLAFVQLSPSVFLFSFNSHPSDAKQPLIGVVLASFIMFCQLFGDQQDSSNGLLRYVRLGHGRGNAIATWPGDQRLAAYSEQLASFRADDRFIDFAYQRMTAFDKYHPAGRDRSETNRQRSAVSRSCTCLFVYSCFDSNTHICEDIYSYV